MSILKSAFISTGQRWQLMFYGDGTFEYRKLRVKDGSLVVTNGEDVVSGWPALNKLTVPFEAFAGIKKGRAVICAENDIIFDVFNRLGDEEKPEKGPGLVKDWIKKKADTVRFRHQAKPKTSSIMNVITFTLSGGVAVMLILVLITAVRGIYAD